jgi:hypothetical protein
MFPLKSQLLPTTGQIDDLSDEVIAALLLKEAEEVRPLLGCWLFIIKSSLRIKDS